jgi:eukaryotic-like serine/threonine-protein kinase
VSRLVVAVSGRTWAVGVVAMSVGEAVPARPLRPGDPDGLGGYRLLGRLGEGGMGVVYLAEAPTGQPVALKVIRGDLAGDPTFRRRFRSEVTRARQVPPFCTAEVLDADPDHDPPYLVVEYVDGPSLATVLEQRGPLTPANLHGVAIGVATALTAIHGAGVIHRDLKPSNVLLALGSPKVIDFGIAQPVHGTASLTTASRVIGTVAYMSPERLGAADTPVTPAADIFAWGALVAYAGTGRHPFSGEVPAVVAAQILTQPPNLTGLDPSLRGPVESALAKDPAARPTARALLDELLAGGPRGGGGLAAAFAKQPELRVAAEGAAAIEGPTVPKGTAPDTAPGRRRSRLVPIALVLALLAVLGLGAAAMATGRISLTPTAGPSAPTSSVPATSPSSPVPALDIPSGYVSVLRDSLAGPGYWSPFVEPSFNVTCAVDNGLTITKTSVGTYRCPGPRDSRTDFVLSVEVTLTGPASCAGVWFRFTGAQGGYALQICPDRYELVTHSGTTITTLRTIRFARPVPDSGTIRVGLAVQGRALRLYRDGSRLAVAELIDTRFSSGRVLFGAFLTGGVPPFNVTFRNVEIWAPGA